MGIVDEDDQTTEIKRRWDAMNKAQGKAADAKAVRRWAMAKEKTELQADDEEGIKLLKALKCELTGAEGIKNTARRGSWLPASLVVRVRARVRV